MMITEQEIINTLPSGLKLILDKEYETISVNEAMRSAKNFARHRNLLGELKKVLDADPQPRMEEVVAVVERWFGIKRTFPFKDNKNDCDNAAVGLLDWFNGRGKDFALAILEGHSANLFIDEFRELHYIEPQTCEIMKTGKRLKITVMP